MDEFGLIELLLEELGDTVRGPLIAIGPGDDSAVTDVPAGMQLVSSIDSLVAGTHFPVDVSAELVGCRAFGVAVSDLAAMGATAGFCVVALTLPTPDVDWVSGFARGLAAAARLQRCAIVGGNLARGPLNVAVSAHGYVPSGQAITRSGAHAGDLIAVSGNLGGAALALDHPRLHTVRTHAELVGIRPDDVGHVDYPLRRYYLPTPRLQLGVLLRGVATAAVDVSDGLLADLGHLCKQSGVAARIDAGRVPCTPGCLVQRALTAGDDYELLFTVPPSRWLEFEKRASATGEGVTLIGEIHAGAGVTVSGGTSEHSKAGYQHFD